MQPRTSHGQQPHPSHHDRQKHVQRQRGRPPQRTDETTWPALVCVLGPFRLLEDRRSVTVHGDSKAALLLAVLVLRWGHDLPRETLLDLLWPEREADLAGQALHSLLHKLVTRHGKESTRPPLVVHDHGGYRLNDAAGVGADLVCFDAIVDAGDAELRAGDHAAAAAAYRHALSLYRGDLFSAPDDTYASVERERLQRRYHGVLMALAEDSYRGGDDAACLDHAQRLLSHDPGREDAHRLAMRCYLRHGERAQALRQYHLCVKALHDEFDAVPEPATVALFDQIRLDPSHVSM